MIKFPGLTSFDKFFTLAAREGLKDVKSNTHAYIHTCTVHCSEISLCHRLELEHQDVTRSTALTVLMQHETVFSKGEKTKHTY